MSDMTPELQQLINTLVLERPERDGRPVPVNLYQEAMEFIQKPPERKLLFCSQELMEKGVNNTLFCGHWIYPMQEVQSRGK
jgi:hypothetical protein